MPFSNCAIWRITEKQVVKTKQKLIKNRAMRSIFFFNILCDLTNSQRNSRNNLRLPRAFQNYIRESRFPSEKPCVPKRARRRQALSAIRSFPCANFSIFQETQCWPYVDNRTKCSVYLDSEQNVPYNYCCILRGFVFLQIAKTSVREIYIFF